MSCRQLWVHLFCVQSVSQLPESRSIAEAHVHFYARACAPEQAPKSCGGECKSDAILPSICLVHACNSVVVTASPVYLHLQ